MKINGLLQAEDIIPAVSADTKEGVLRELAAKAVERHSGLDREELLKILLERERLGSTGIGDGIAIPHGKLKRLARPVLVFGRSLKGIDFDALDGRKVYLLFLIMASEDAVGVHLKLLARISRILKDSDVRRALLDAPDAAAMYEIIREQDSRY
ncbi:MAG TPA: PTS sugar transporter subunit IIA [Geobacteraceae bacterium]|nr:PTS sugar transporter subunit IIA [Geobacteraceae bacterium]